MARVSRRPGTRLAGLVLNERGLERALATGVDEVNVVVLVTETFSRRNQGMGVEDAAVDVVTGGDRSLGRRRRRLGHVVGGLRLSLRGGGRARPGCGSWPDGWPRPGPSRSRWPTRSDVPFLPRSRCWCATSASTPGCRSGSTSTTAGTPGTPMRWPPSEPGRRHSTPASAGSVVARSLRARPGNIASEDLVHLLDRMGIATGVSLHGLLEASRWLADTLGRPLPGQVVRSGPFPSGAHAASAPAAVPSRSRKLSQ